MIVKGTGKKDKAGNVLAKDQAFEVSEKVAEILIKKGMAKKEGAKSTSNKQEDPTEEKKAKSKPKGKKKS